MNPSNENDVKGGPKLPPPIPMQAGSGKHSRSGFSLVGFGAFAVGIICLGLAFVIVATKTQASDVPGRAHGVANLRALASLRFPADLQQARALCTDNGYSIVASCVTNANLGDFLGTYKITGMKYNPNLTDVRMVRDTADGKTIVWARMVNRDGWKFEDLYVERVNGKEWRWWMSKAIEHPVPAVLDYYSDDIGKGLDTATRVLEFFNQLKALDQDNHSSR